ncbi:MAG: hypothetical protein K2K48_07380 [Anaeroplasmataceae bacterium]|nr:hypothetical protein [Anaeroplasmataceae bacterium]
MKKICLLIIFLLLMSTPLYASANHTKNFCDFSSSKEIIFRKELQDFSNNEFILYELKDGYAIYSVIDDEEIFIEGSFESNSPFYNYLTSSLYYLGPGEYYYADGSTAVNIITSDSINIKDVDYSFKLPLSASTYSADPEPNPNLTTINTDGFITIKDSLYFEKLITFPYNYFGDCGLVALSMLLGYLDTFHNDNFIPNNLKYEGKYYKVESNKWVYDYSVEEPLLKKARLTFSENSSYEFGFWDYMPGPTHALRDYLFDNYLHTYLIKDDEKGYPMLDEELKKTINDYMDENCPSLKEKVKIRSGNVFFTHQRPKEYICNGVPTILVLESYQSTVTDKKQQYHDVVAYGYKDDTFLVHMGWSPESTEYTKVIISNAVIYGFYAIDYVGEHVHSENIYMNYGCLYRNICGCGYIRDVYNHDLCYKSYVKNHLVYCKLCDYSYYEKHDFYTIGEEIIRPNAFQVCRKCGFKNSLDLLGE